MSKKKSYMLRFLKIVKKKINRNKFARWEKKRVRPMLSSIFCGLKTHTQEKKTYPPKIEFYPFPYYHCSRFNRSHMLCVEKIGGTSMSSFADVIQNIILGKNQKNSLNNRIFVVSAYNNVTNWLLEHKKTGEPGVYSAFSSHGDYASALDQVLAKLLEINKSLSKLKLSAEADKFITGRIRQTKNYLASLADVLASGYVNQRDVLLAAREILASIGESHSAYNSADILNNLGIKTELYDLSGFEDAQQLTIDERIRQAFKSRILSKSLAVVTGYCKGTEGIMREFDRGYSEVTFSKIAVAVKADEAIIHKEFHLSSADPNLVGTENAIPVGFTNFDVADQIADVGMEAIHPKASKPIENAGINLRIKNTFEPEHPGTLITKNYRGPKARVEIITGTDKVTMIDIHDPSMVGEPGFDLGIMKIFSEFSLSYILKCTNANSITLAIWEKHLSAPFLKALKKPRWKIRIKPAALVCVIGSNIAIPGVLARAAKALSDSNINIDGVSQSINQVNMQFVINRRDYKKAVAAMHKSLCEENNQEVITSGGHPKR